MNNRGHPTRQSIETTKLAEEVRHERGEVNHLHEMERKNNHLPPQEQVRVRATMRRASKVECTPTGAMSRQLVLGLTLQLVIFFDLGYSALRWDCLFLPKRIHRPASGDPPATSSGTPPASHQEFRQRLHQKFIRSLVEELRLWVVVLFSFAYLDSAV